MAFLDNSGDIILDAVLTDTGRKLLARGDGSFEVTKFAFGDDEINYELYNATHASGSAYYDLDILQSPVLEAFTNNTSGMKSKLITLSNNNLRYLPVVKLNTDGDASGAVLGGSAGVPGNDGILQSKFFDVTDTATAGSTYVVLADENTLKLFTSAGLANDAAQDNVREGRTQNSTRVGLLAAFHGTNVGNTPVYQRDGNLALSFDQGIDNTAEGTELLLPGNSLYETQYLVEVDNRLLRIMRPNGSAFAPRSFVDDDNVASYFFAIQDVAQDVSNNSETVKVDHYFSTIRVEENGPVSTIAGRAGSRFSFRLAVTTEVEVSTASSNYLFTTFGDEPAVADAGDAGGAYRRINTNIRVTGMTTGYRVSIPIQILKAESTI